MFIILYIVSLWKWSHIIIYDFSVCGLISCKNLDNMDEFENNIAISQ